MSSVCAPIDTYVNENKNESVQYNTLHRYWFISITGLRSKILSEKLNKQIRSGSHDYWVSHWFPRDFYFSNQRVHTRIIQYTHALQMRFIACNREVNIIITFEMLFPDIVLLKFTTVYLETYRSGVRFCHYRRFIIKDCTNNTMYYAL